MHDNELETSLSVGRNQYIKLPNSLVKAQLVSRCDDSCHTTSLSTLIVFTEMT